MANLSSPIKAAFLASLVALAATAEADEAAYSLWLEFSSADEVLASVMGGEPPTAPSDGRVLLLGRMDHVGFYLEDLNAITVESPDGAQIPLLIDASSKIEEFGAVVSMSFAFELPPAEADGGGEGYHLRWGDGISANNQIVGKLALDPDKLDLYRQFRWKESLGGGADAEAPFSTITVIADSTAEYHFLWYLLPMGLIFVILTVRKLWLPAALPANRRQ